MSPSAVSQQSQSNVAKALTEVQPPLRNALSSLNINLDYELARYRYAKRGDVQPSVKPPQFQPRRRSLNLINVPPQPSRPASPQSAAAPPPPPPNPRIPSQTAPPNAAVPPTVGENPVGATAGQPMSEVAALRSAIVHQPTTAAGTYLASSEALLENFEPPASGGYRSEPTMEQPNRSGFANWNTPLGIGALLLLLVASAGFGFLLVNPTVAQNLFRGTPLAQFWASPLDEEAAIAPDELVIEESEETADFDGPPLNSLSPDLSQREFSELDLNTLSNLPSGSDRATDRAPAVGVEESEEADAAGDRESRRATAANPSAREPQEVNEMPRTTTPAPRPQATAPTYEQPYQAPAPTSAPAPQPAPAASAPPLQPAPSATETAPASREPISSYYVVADYTGDPSLESAREAVGDAYVRNFDDGARIQLGAFNTEAGAAALVEELQNQGIEVRIYEP